MGSCVSRRQPTIKGEFNWKQVHHLELMFEDLSSRSKNGTVTKQIFKCFFNLNGLWGEEIFRKFDKRNKGQLDFIDFCQGLDMLVNGNYQRQIYYLYQFYKTPKENGIRYNELLKMFYSYSVKELLNLVDDAEFLKTMKQPQRKYLFGKNSELDPLREVVEQSSSSEEEQQTEIRKIGQFGRKSNVNNPTKCFNSQKLIIQKSHKDIDKASQNQNKENQQQKNSSKEIQSLKKLNPLQKRKQKPPIQQRRRQTLCYSSLKKHQIKTIPTISLLAKKFATYLFKEFKLDKDKDSLSYKQFQQLVSNHQKLFISYFQGFHQYIWQIKEQEIPEYLKMTSWIEGFCTVYITKSDNYSKRYLRFFKTTLLLFRNKEQTFPQFIINLQGLLVSKFEKGKQFGFLIQHRDGLYPQKAYLFSTQSIQQDWAWHLQSYMNNSIHQQYNILNRIGSGNYSVVHKATSNKTNNEVAIKVIQKFKLSLVQKQVIKMQCGILELALHPSIVTFVQKVQTKTHLYLITEYMQDGDLLDYVKKKTFLDEYQAAIIMSQLFSGVEYLNSLSIIHRDLKCQNIMVKINQNKNEIQKVKIIDFGFAVYKDMLEKLPQKEKYVGTPNYVAPQMLKNQKFSQKVDMFSLGVIMFYILCGYLPFDSLFMEEITESTVNCSYDIEGREWQIVSNDAKDLISKLLCDQDKRITVHQALKHPWLKTKDELKSATKRSKIPKYI